METYSIDVREIPQISRIGDKVYVIHQYNSRTFTQKCQVCDDTKKITYRGYEMPCPYCVGGTYRSGNLVRNTCTVYGLEVEEFIVNSVVIEGPDTKSAYATKNKGSIISAPKVAGVYAFTRRNGSSSSIATVKVPNGGLYLDPEEKYILNALHLDSFVFTTRKKAEAAVSLLVGKEKERLAEFNAKYECSYEYPFEEAKK